MQKDWLRWENYEKEKHIAKDLAHHANCMIEKEYLVAHADYFYIQETEDKTNIVRENNGHSYKKTAAEADWSCTRITTVVGSQRHRNRKVTKNYFLTTESDLFARPETGQVPVIASHEAEEEPRVPKNDAEVQAPEKTKFGDFKGFKRT